MNFLELAKSRFSVRKYKPIPVKDDDLNYVLEAGRIAPSAVNYQPWHFLVLREKESLEKIRQTYLREWFKEAPIVIVLLGDHIRGWKRADGKVHTDIDVAIAADHMTLAAADRGLGTCWVCNFDKKKTVELFNLPDYLEPIVFLPLGYTDVQAEQERHIEKRKPLSDIISFERL